MRAITFSTPYSRELADDDVVLVVAGRGDELVARRLMPGARARDLGRVAADHLVLELDRASYRYGRCSIRVTWWPPRSRTGCAGSDLPPPAMRRYISQVLGLAHRGDEGLVMDEVGQTMQPRVA
jgi:hypothetical protein